jgi:RimJ/RimL family protein N-acetyltransferase
MLEHAFRLVDRVVFVVGENNLRSQKALEKIGAKLLKKVQRPMRDGGMSPHLVFVISRTRVRRKIEGD